LVKSIHRYVPDNMPDPHQIHRYVLDNIRDSHQVHRYVLDDILEPAIVSPRTIHYFISIPTLDNDCTQRNHVTAAYYYTVKSEKTGCQTTFAVAIDAGAVWPHWLGAVFSGRRFQPVVCLWVG
jgi:hypothetical protein